MQNNLLTLNNFCLEKFPELEAVYSRERLRDAAELGAYILHEDFLLQWAISVERSREDLKRISGYIEVLAASEHFEIRNLAQIALLEGLVNNDTVAIAPLLGDRAKAILEEEVVKNIKFDQKSWLVELG